MRQSGRDRVSVAWIAFGSNLEAPGDQVRSALYALADTTGLRLLDVSRLYRTAPVGGATDQPDYCNACAAFATCYTPLALLDVLQALEHRQGRQRKQRWGARTLDLDMIAYDDRVLHHERLVLPHPRASERGFVLVPLAEIAPALCLAGAGRVMDLAGACGDQRVELWSSA